MSHIHRVRLAWELRFWLLLHAIHFTLLRRRSRVMIQFFVDAVQWSRVASRLRIRHDYERNECFWTRCACFQLAFLSNLVQVCLLYLLLEDIIGTQQLTNDNEHMANYFSYNRAHLHLFSPFRLDQFIVWQVNTLTSTRASLVKVKCPETYADPDSVCIRCSFETPMPSSQCTHESFIVAIICRISVQ